MPATVPAEPLIRRFLAVRAGTEALAAPLSPEDQQVQSMPSASPVKWHRAHTTWFFETFVLAPRGALPVDPRYTDLYNSYYNAVGPLFARDERGLITRPSAAEVGAYRGAVDARVVELLVGLDARGLADVRPVVELGLAHEEQHQELILTDVLHALSRNPLAPIYRAAPPGAASARPPVAPLEFHAFAGGVCARGAPDDGEFAFDNERPRHRVFLEPFALASRLVTWAELRAFVDARGYQTPSLWLADGWDLVRREGWTAPLYARLDGGVWRVFGLHGERTPRDDEPAAHLGYYEADAVARFLGARLPTEAEWEHAAAGVAPTGHFRSDGPLHPLAAPRAARTAAAPGPQQLFGDLWEWTSSGYEAYPGYQAGPGALGEYNGKFMSGQQVLRGGSCFTPPGHVRATYRNFWHPSTRFQMTGLRLARTS